MFDISWSELLLIAVVALVFIGPKELPGVLRTVGQWTAKIRRMAGEFQDQFRDAMREVEMADLKKEVDEATRNLNTGLDPFAGIKETVEWKPSATPSAPAAADAPPAPPAEAIVAEPAGAAPPAHEAAGAAPAPAPAPPPAGGDRAA